MGEPAGRRLVVAVDRRLQQKRSWIILARCNQELTQPTLTGQGPFIMVSSRMLKNFAGGVLASFPGTVKRGAAAELRPCLGQGASRRARVGRVRSLAFLSTLLSVSWMSCPREALTPQPPCLPSLLLRPAHVPMA